MQKVKKIDWDSNSDKIIYLTVKIIHFLKAK